jgi:hypothetical protein
VLIMSALSAPKYGRWTARQLLQHPWVTGEPLPISADTPVPLNLSLGPGSRSNPPSAPATLANALPPLLAEAHYGSGRSFRAMGTYTRDAAKQDAVVCPRQLI